MCKQATSFFDKDLLDLRHLKWDTNPSGTKGTAGTFLKAFDENLVPTRCYKLSTGDTLSGIYGHESANEVIVSRFLDMLSIPHLHYDGAYSRIILGGKEHLAYVCWSDSFRNPGESKIALDTYFALHNEEYASVEDMLRTDGYSKYLDVMLLVDFLIINRDRHGANLEVLSSSSSDKVRLSPLFDNGFSLVAPLQNHIESIELFDAMRDVEANNFIGSRSLFDNLNLIRNAVEVTPLDTGRLSELFVGTEEALSVTHISKITEILKKRYCYARDKKVLCEIGR